MLIRLSLVYAGTPSLKRRLLAFLIDFWFIVFTLGPVVALIPLSLEAARLGHFSWHFQRDYYASSDIVLLPLVLFSMAAVALYFVFPLTRGRQTVGCFVMGLVVAPPFGDRGRFTFREPLRRLGYIFWGLATWKEASKGFVDGQGRTWWDRETNSRVTLVRYD